MKAKILFCAAAPATAKSLQSCPTLCDPIDGSPSGSPVPGNSPGKNTGVGCHFLLQCTEVKSESEVTQSCPTPSDPMDHSLPGSSIYGIFQARVLQWGAIAFSIFCANGTQMRGLHKMWLSFLSQYCLVSEGESRSVMSDSCDPVNYTAHGIL